MRSRGRFLGRVLVAGVVAWNAVPVLAADPDIADDGRGGATIVASCVIPQVTLAEPTGDQPAVMLGGISDLAVERADVAAAGCWKAWVVTDRGPNGIVEVDGREHRTLVSPSFAPRVLALAIDWEPRHPPKLAARVTETMPLVDRDGAPLSGRPNGLKNDPHIVDPSGHVAIAADPDGVDTEGLVRTRDGGFWVAEEYRPSLLAIDGDGTARRRFVPRGTSLMGAGMEIVDTLPEVYADRRDNRGFEALAITPDESRLFVLLQSPADRPDRDTAEQVGNVRLLTFDTAADRPAAEHVYRLGDPSPRGYRRGEKPPDDGKLCAMAAVGPSSLVVLEQAAGGVARLYLAELAAATNTLSRTTAGDNPPLESVRGLDAAGIHPVEKTLLADLRPMLDEMRSQAGLLDEDAGPLKVEGLAVIDQQHILLVNDDDFGVGKDDTTRPSGTCLWLLRLATPLPSAQL